MFTLFLTPEILKQGFNGLIVISIWSTIERIQGYKSDDHLIEYTIVAILK